VARACTSSCHWHQPTMTRRPPAGSVNMSKVIPRYPVPKSVRRNRGQNLHRPVQSQRADDFGGLPFSSRSRPGTGVDAGSLWEQLSDPPGAKSRTPSWTAIGVPVVSRRMTQKAFLEFHGSDQAKPRAAAMEGVGYEPKTISAFTSARSASRAEKWQFPSPAVPYLAMPSSVLSVDYSCHSARVGAPPSVLFSNEIYWIVDSPWNICSMPQAFRSLGFRFVSGECIDGTFRPISELVWVYEFDFTLNPAKTGFWRLPPQMESPEPRHQIAEQFIVYAEDPVVRGLLRQVMFLLQTERLILSG